MDKQVHEFQDTHAQVCKQMVRHATDINGMISGCTARSMNTKEQFRGHQILKFQQSSKEGQVKRGSKSNKLFPVFITMQVCKSIKGFDHEKLASINSHKGNIFWQVIKTCTSH